MKRLRFQILLGGDARSFTIAAASIVAKVTRDRLMRELDIRFSTVWLCSGTRDMERASTLKLSARMVYAKFIADRFIHLLFRKNFSSESIDCS